MFALILVAIGYFTQLNQEVVYGNAIVIDGDSIRLNGQEIRLLGIDAPEYKQICKTSDNTTQYNCGKIAREKLRRLISANRVMCEGAEFDKYDRLLAICKVGEVEINRQLVLEGWAVAFGAYYQEEAAAENTKKGLWAGEFQSPSQWRRDARDAHSVNVISRLYEKIFK